VPAETLPTHLKSHSLRNDRAARAILAMLAARSWAPGRRPQLFQPNDGAMALQPGAADRSAIPKRLQQKTAELDSGSDNREPERSVRVRRLKGRLNPSTGHSSWSWRRWTSQGRFAHEPDGDRRFCRAGRKFHAEPPRNVRSWRALQIGRLPQKGAQKPKALKLALLLVSCFGYVESQYSVSPVGYTGRFLRVKSSKCRPRPVSRGLGAARFRRRVGRDKASGCIWEKACSNRVDDGKGRQV
jgi:hypothetical protein